MWLGRNSLLLYIWHYAIFMFVAPHAARVDLAGADRGRGAGDAGHLRRGHRMLERRVLAGCVPRLAGPRRGVPHWVRVRTPPFVAQLRVRSGRDDAHAADDGTEADRRREDADLG